MKYYYIVSQNTTCLCLHTENIAIKETFQEALDKLNSYSDKGYQIGSGTITKINDNCEGQFIWIYHEGALISKFDCIKNKKLSIYDDFDEETRLDSLASDVLSSNYFSYFQNSLSNCLSKSSVYELQKEIAENKCLTEEHRNKLKEESESLINLLDEKMEIINDY